MRENIKVLITKEEVEKRLSEVGKQISDDYAGKEVTVVIVLKGAFISAATLLMNVNADVKIEFIRVSSYGDDFETSGNINVILDIAKDLTGKNILILEDIIDTGVTLDYLKKEYIKRNASSVKIFTLLNKEVRRKNDCKADYIGFNIDDKFIVGYGFDYKDKLRELPFIGYVE